ncbi:MAG: HAD family hydrolase [Ruminococcaceae bacterium]|nr:HAD family hydrolase [Oscillospiraceae bacterium]
MAVKAIIFDKDGTLIDFDSFWISVSIEVINDIIDRFQMTDIPSADFLEAIGVKDGVTDIDGILCKGTYEETAESFLKVAKKYGYHVELSEISPFVTQSYNKNSRHGTVRGTCDNLRGVLKSLKEQGIKLFVVTTDNPEITSLCLEKLGVSDLFEKVFTDDDITPPKPDPSCAFKISEEYSIDLSDIIMVGDTMTDVRFAKNAGIRVISVGANEENRKRLVPYADIVLRDVSCIPEQIGEGILC